MVGGTDGVGGGCGAWPRRNRMRNCANCIPTNFRFRFTHLPIQAGTLQHTHTHTFRTELDAKITIQFGDVSVCGRGYFGFGPPAAPATYSARAPLDFIFVFLPAPLPPNSGSEPEREPFPHASCFSAFPNRFL